MTRFAPLASVLLSLTSLAACDLANPSDDDAGDAGSDGAMDEGDTGGESGGDTGDDGGSDSGESGSDDGVDDGTDESGDDTGGPAGVWTELEGPCGGSATNAMWFDDREHGFIGCGENAVGEGLFTTADGMTWDDNPKFNEVRIMDLRRGPDGVLRAAGTHQLDGFAAMAIDEDGALDSIGLYTPSNNAFTSVGQAENIAVTEDGQILIDSLTGTSAAYQPAGGAFAELDSLGEAVLDDPDALSFQVRRIVAFDNSFYAVGSLINDPARVHLPSKHPDATYHFTTLELQPSTRDGELLDMHVWDAESMLVMGHDQSERYPLIYTCAGDCYSLDAWTQIELLDFGLEYQGGVNDLHVVGDTVIAVGEKFINASGGFVLRSEDRGQTWTDITPEGAGELSAVWLFDDGSIVVGGGGGEMWAYE